MVIFNLLAKTNLFANPVPCTSENQVIPEGKLGTFSDRRLSEKTHKPWNVSFIFCTNFVLKSPN